MSKDDPRPSRRINEILDEEVRDAARHGRHVGRKTLEAPAPSGKVTVVVDDADRFGVMAGPMGAERQGGRPSDVPAQAEETVRRLNYIQEPLAVIETEGRRGRSILRSVAPRKTDGGREYNEAVLEGGGSITIRRFRSESGARRRPVPSNLSRETLGRLVDDLADILRPR